MEGYFPLKMKRKDLEDVTDYFSDFSLCSPARKIRRLDAELPPIIEDCEIPMRFEESVPKNLGVLKIEELPIENEERAIVLFKPVDSPLQQLPSRFSVAVDPHIISGIKNQVRQSNESCPWRIVNEKAESEDGNLQSNYGCLAVIPWVPSPFPSMHEAELGQQTSTSEMMEAEATEEATMDVEDDVVVDQDNVYVPGAANHLHQWQQQHCMIPQLSHNPSTPIVWYR